MVLCTILSQNHLLTPPPSPDSSAETLSRVFSFECLIFALKPLLDRGLVLQLEPSLVLLRPLEPHQPCFPHDCQQIESVKDQDLG